MHHQSVERTPVDPLSLAPPTASPVIIAAIRSGARADQRRYRLAQVTARTCGNEGRMRFLRQRSSVGIVQRIGRVRKQLAFEIDLGIIIHRQIIGVTQRGRSEV